MAGLKRWEQIIDEDKIYPIFRETGNYETLKPLLHIKGTGTIDILGSQENPVSSSDMTLEAQDTNLSEGYREFSVVPNYLLVRANQAGARTVVLTGFKVPAIGRELAWNLSTTVFQQSLSVIIQDTNLRNVFFRADGLKLYLLGFQNLSIYEYDLSIAWDITTATLLQSLSVAAQDTEVTSIFLRADGLKLYLSGQQNSSIYEYDLSIAWDITTATLLQSLSVAAQDTAGNSIFFRADGLKLYLLGQQFNSIYEFDLSIAWDITTATLLQSLSIAAQDTQGSSIFLRADGLKLYLLGFEFNSVHEYDLSIAWNSTTATLLQSFSVAAQDTSAWGVFFRPNGLNMFISGNDTSTIYQYQLG